MKLLHLQDTPILQQLQIEEALLRADDQNWCIINHGSTPAVVMGISGPLLELDLVRLDQLHVPVIKRFSGGGTVVVDQDTIFITLLGNHSLLPCKPYPEPIMRWTEPIYKEATGLPEFALRENDYVIGEKKCGGNAQYLRKDRWLHHTTFLWDYHDELMECLHLPSKRPTYRSDRHHFDFLCRLETYLPSPKAFIDRFVESLDRQIPLTIAHIDDVTSTLDLPHRKATQLIDFKPLLNDNFSDV